MLVVPSDILVNERPIHHTLIHPTLIRRGGESHDILTRTVKPNPIHSLSVIVAGDDIHHNSPCDGIVSTTSTHSITNLNHVFPFVLSGSYQTFFAPSTPLLGGFRKPFVQSIYASAVSTGDFDFLVANSD